MVLVDKQLKKRAFWARPDCINPASIDLTIGGTEPVTIPPYGGALVSTQEYIDLAPVYAQDVLHLLNSLDPIEIQRANAVREIILEETKEESSLLYTAEDDDLILPSACGLLTLKSSALRGNLFLAAPGWVDPGFCGNLTFRVMNIPSLYNGIYEYMISFFRRMSVDPKGNHQLPSRSHLGDIVLEPGQKIAQLVLFDIDAEPEQLYTGKYQGSVGTTGAR